MIHCDNSLPTHVKKVGVPLRNLNRKDRNSEIQNKHAVMGIISKTGPRSYFVREYDPNGDDTAESCSSRIIWLAKMLGGEKIVHKYTGGWDHEAECLYGCYVWLASVLDGKTTIEAEDSYSSCQRRVKANRWDFDKYA